MHKLYVVHSSHPSEAVRKALALKGIPYKTVELLIPTQAPLMRLRFGRRTVPALKLDGGEKVSGSRAIMRKLDELVADPPLLPPETDPAGRAAVLEAERWGEEVLQPLVRRITWAALKRRPGAIPSYQEASQLPRLPRPVVRIVGPGVIAIERRMIGAGDGAVRSDLRALPGHLDHVDDLIARGVIGSDPDQPNAADLQIGSSLRLLATIGDARAMLDGRPAAELALRLFGDFPGNLPAGAFPPDWLRAA
ncbi:MAG: glutathione S-transferase family protein [Solirubrobacteraceae bacterium]|nr:glutathione S-transferase family protein [Solirubrobacteraceae bacterium]